MNIDKFDQKIGAIRRCVAELQCNGDSNQQQLLTDAFRELHKALEDLDIANQELRQQSEELSAAQVAVEADRQRYQDLFEFAPDGYLVTDAYGMIREANRAAATLLNINRQFLVGKPLVVFIAESEHQAFLASLNELQQKDWTHPLEVRLQPRKDVSFDAALTVAAIRDSEGKLIALRWLLHDFTERKRAELALQQLNANLERQVQERTKQLQQALDFEAMLKRITDKVRDSLDESQILQVVVGELAVVLNIDGCDTGLYDANQTTSTISYEHTTKLPKVRGHVVQMAGFWEGYSQLLQSQYFQFCELVPILRGPVAILACPIFDDRGVLGDLCLFKQRHDAFNELEIRLVQQVANQCAIAIRQARLYQAATAQVEELEKLNRLKDEFLSTVSHELRTPLSNMKMAIQMLQIAPAPEQQKRYLKVLQAECDREVELINDLLDLQQLEAMSYQGEIAAINLQDWLPGITKTFLVRTQERRQLLRIDLPPSLSELSCDRPSLGRVLTELLNNAYKYTPASGEIVLSVRQEESEEWRVGSGEESSSTPSTIFSISNSVEIPPAELPHIFKKFYRVPNANPWQQSGTGLGLALVQKLVEHMQGTIKVESFKKRTTFTVQLPAMPKL